MAKFKVEITETLRRVVEVEAIDASEAEDKVEEQWSDSDIVLDYDDFDGVTFVAKKVVE